MGIVSNIGNDLDTVADNLKNSKSDIIFNQSYADNGFKSCVSGSIDQKTLNTSAIDRKLKRFMSDASLYAYVSALSAIDNAGLSLDDIADDVRVAVVAGSGGASTADVVNSVDNMKAKGLRGVGASAR